MGKLEKKLGFGKRALGVGITLGGLLAGTILALGAVGCNTGPQKCFFGAPIGATEKRIAALPPSFYLWIVHGGQYHVKKIFEKNETIGYDISYHRWTEAVGLKLKGETQKIRIPGAKNMCIKQNQVLNDRFNLTYIDEYGQERLNIYHLGFAGNQCKLANQYIIEKGEKIKIEN